MGGQDSPEKEIATHCNILAWEIPWTEEPGRLQSMGSQRVGHSLVHTHTHTHTLIIIKLLNSLSRKKESLPKCKIYEFIVLRDSTFLMI